jgi:hypothetical protein
MTIARTIAAAAVGTVVGTAASVGVLAATADTAPLPHRAPFMRTLCPAEDALDCAWNARRQGNGEGASFYAVRVRLLGVNGHRLGVVGCHYLVPERLTRYDSCQVLHRRVK